MRNSALPIHHLLVPGGYRCKNNHLASVALTIWYLLPIY